MAVPLTFRERLDRKLPRLIKHSKQWLRVAAAGRRQAPRLVFVIGSQRSGTRLPLQLMDHSPDIITFSEGTAPYFDSVLLCSLDRIDERHRRSMFPVVALKPICETHRVNELLGRFPGSKAVWIFRHFEPAVTSASKKWKSGREGVRRLATGNLDRAGWRAGGLTPEKLALVRRLYRDDMSLHEANAVMWYLRNSLFFDLGADRRPDVLLVRYEDLLADPNVHGGRMFEFIGVDVPEGFQQSIRQSSGSRREFPPMAEEIRALCTDVHDRLLRHYREASAGASIEAR
jgi:hypothetical protein